MVDLFRRLRRDKSADEPEEEPTPPAETENKRPPLSPPPPETKARPVQRPNPETRPPAPDRPPAKPLTPRPVAVKPPVAATAPVRPVAPTDHGPPPPLPEPDLEGSMPPQRPRAPSSRCFLCGTDMDGPWCPKCRMAWND
jgi:hypothetical protein